MPPTDSPTPQQRIAELERTVRELEARLQGRETAPARPLATADAGELPLPGECDTRFRTIVESSPMGIHMYRLDPAGELIFTGYNPAADRILGLDNSQFLGKTITEAFPFHRNTEIPRRYREVCRTGAAWETRQIDYRDERIDGAFEVIAFQTEPGAMAAMFLDITDRLRAEERVRRSEQRLHLALEGADLGLWDWDIVTGAVYFDPRWYTMLGYRPDELVASYGTWHDLLHPEDRAMAEQTVADGVARDLPWNIEFRLRSKDGGWRWILGRGRVVERDDDGRPRRAAGTHLDITGRKEAEKDRQRREATLQSLLFVAPIGIGLVTRRTFDWVSGRLCEMTGYSPEELIGQSARILYHSDEEFERVGTIKYNDQLCRGERIGCLDTIWRRKDGSLIDVHLRSAPLVAGDLDQGVTFTALDITERRRAEKKRLAMEKQLLHVQKLESLGILAGGIAHDFNNLLMAILGNADLALAEMSAVSPARENIIAIEKASQRAAELCKQMLAYSGKGRFEIRLIDLSELVREMVHMLEVSISKRALLRYDFAPVLPAVRADATQLRQIVMNLIVNASEAIGDRSGIISITTGAMDCDEAYLRTAYLDEQRPAGPYVYIEVSDTGCGMDEETVARLFDPFFTTKFTGRGLGMSAVLGIVRGHQGSIKVYSETGRGTTIKVLFPAEDRLAENARPADERTGGWRGSGTVLLVDDEETVRSVGRQMLERLGFKVLLAEDGRRAMELFRPAPGAIDLVLLDLTMPHMDGEQTYRAMRTVKPDVRVILCSGYSEQEVTRQFLGKGLAGFIQKPYRLATLQEKLQAVLTARDGGPP
ncbi:MAG: PAS domain S-box protein [Thermodesulfobacteriota bacterium]